MKWKRDEPFINKSSMVLFKESHGAWIGELSRSSPNEARGRPSETGERKAKLMRAMKETMVDGGGLARIG